MIESEMSSIDDRRIALRLRVSDLRVESSQDGLDIVDDVGFSIAGGEVLGLVGESGSGKTTVALALLAYVRRGLRIAGGEVQLEHQDLLSLSPSELREARGRLVAYVPQDPASALNPAIRVGAQIEEALLVHAQFAASAAERTRELLLEVHLDPSSGLLNKYPHQLSGGQQQRVAIAMAFACRPSLIVLDEPTTGLDVSTQRRVIETIRELCERYDAAAVYVSHDLAVVSGLADRLVVMYAGRVVEFGRAADIFRRPRHPYTRGLLAAIPRVESAEVLTGIPGRAPRPGQRPDGCSFASRCPLAREQCAVPPPSSDVDGVMTRCWRAADETRSEVRQRRMMPASTPLGDIVVRAEAIQASYGETAVVHGVSIDLRRETCTALVGESGSGKTTLARCLVGLHANYTGTVSLDGHTLPRSCRSRTRDDLRAVQYIFQSPYGSLNPRRTIGQSLEQYVRNFFDVGGPERRARVERALADVSLESSVVRRFPDELSGGERQRAAIARALVAEPQVLVCDEVTSALDVSVQSVVVELLRTLQRERSIAIAFITHNIALVRSIAQEVVVLAGGQIVEAGSTDAVLDAPHEAYTIQLVGDVPRLVSASAR
jgi:peptide/nickel transport system ATP-binding protein